MTARPRSATRSPTRRATSTVPATSGAAGPALGSVYSNESGRSYHLERLIGHTPTSLRSAVDASLATLAA